MHRPFRSSSLAALALAAFLCLPVAAADEPVPLESVVGADEYRAMGLDKLSAEEQAQLARWIRLRTEGRPVPIAPPTVSFGVDGATLTATISAPPPATKPAPAPAPVAAPAIGTADAFGLEQDQVDGEVTEIRARVVGAFTGWTGKTVFVLDNGQVWRQSTPGSYNFKASDPEVIIEKGFIGYKLRLVETRRSIAVRRVK